MITQKQVQTMFEYREDGHLIRKTQPCNKVKIGDDAGAVGTCGYMVVSVNGRRYKLHRVVFLWHHGYMPDTVDHDDGDKLNNRIGNLRECTKQQNGFNRKSSKSSSSVYKGVSWCRTHKKWLAQYKLEGKRQHIGYFEDEVDAAQAYDDTVKEFQGEFFSPNFPEPTLPSRCT